MTKNKTFRNVVLCHTDDFPPNKNDKIKGWVEKHGGTFTKALMPNVTHFVSSKRAWKKYLPVGKLATLIPQEEMLGIHTCHEAVASTTHHPSSGSSASEEHKSRHF
jgi:hypothetical protein